MSRVLEDIALTLRKNSRVEVIKDRLAPQVEELRRRLNRKLSTTLKENSVGGHFPDTIASRRLLNSLVLELRKRPGENALQLRLRVRKGTGSINEPGAEEYFFAISDASLRRGGPSISRVLQWMVERKIIPNADPNREVVLPRVSSKGEVYDRSRVVTAIWLARRIQKTIVRKTKIRAYKSLHLTEKLYGILKVNEQNLLVKGIRKNIAYSRKAS